MRIAIIDLGTNSVRFDIHLITPDRKTKLLHRERLMIRLGQGVFIKGKIDALATARTLHAFSHFRKVATRLKVSKMVAFGTSALREASDSDVLVQKIKEHAGIEVKVISGVEEARLIALGIMSKEKVPSTQYALVDIGGGSTEINICKGRKILFSYSFDLGTARLQQVFLKKSPPRESAIIEMRKYIFNTIRPKMIEDGWRPITFAIGSSGTIRSTQKILKKKFKAKNIDCNALPALVAEMGKMNTSQLLNIPDMESKRVDMMFAGVLLLDEIIKILQIKKMQISEHSLRDGILEEEIRLVKQKKTSRIELHMEDLFEKSKRYGVDQDYIRHMAKMADDLFERLSRIHKLNRKWKIYFTASVVLRDLGELVNISNYAKHTYYIVKNTDLPSMQKWENEFIAQLCLNQANEKVKIKAVTVFKEEERRTAFIKILAMLRIIDALDFGAENIFNIHSIKVNRGSVNIKLKGGVTKGIEGIMIDRKKKLFEKVFNKKIELVR